MVPLFLPITWSSSMSWSGVPVNALIAQQHFEAPQRCKKAKKKMGTPSLVFILVKL